jgi:hypothetical protein
MRGFIGGYRLGFTGCGGSRFGCRFAYSRPLLRGGFTCHGALGILFSVRGVGNKGARTAAVGSCRRTSAADRRPELRALRVRFLCVGWF